MYLSFKEIWHEKRRYLLIVLVISMISYLVFFLSSLALGLVSANRSAIDSWPVDGIVLSADANQNISASSLDLVKQNDIQAKSIEPINISLQVIYDENQERHNVAFVGLNKFPNAITGKAPKSSHEVLASQAVRSLYGISINDTIRVAKTGREFKITGLVSNEKYNTAPVIYTELNMSSANMMLYTKNDPNIDAMASATPNMPERVNGFLVNGFQSAKDMEYLTKDEWIQALPGYQAQVLTFGLMIGFLILISSAILGIFIYILTLQKKIIFGILKAQGIQNQYLIRSIFIQTLILVILGLILGLALTIITLLALPADVPTSYAWSIYGLVSLLMIFFSLWGAFFSGQLISKIDPLQAIE